ncbi:MAG: sulfotransferase, partial [Polyangiaceae bacterium]
PCPCGSGRKSKHCCGGAKASRPSPALAPAQSLQPLLQAAERALQAGDPARAVAALEQVLRVQPDHGPALHDLGMAHLAMRRFPQAIAALRRAVALRPAFAPSHYGLGVALEQTGDDAAAMACHRRAVELAPKLAEAHTHIANLLVPKGKWQEAASAYQKAYAAAPETTLGLLGRAKGLIVQDRPAEAEARLRELVARDPASSEGHLVLAHVLTEAGRFDDAVTHYERSLALAPRQATAFSGLVTAKKLTEADRPLLGRILARLDAGDLPERHRMTLHFAAGKALDDLGVPAEAIVHFDAANAIRRRLAPFDRGDFERRVDRLAGRFTRAFFEASAALGDPDPTPVLVLGMPRSGTTLVERFVSSHPGVAGGGELVFWNDHAPAACDATPEQLGASAAALRRDYLAVLRRIGPEALRVTDKMPFNFLWIGLVHALFPNARFVHCRRNPLDTCLSIYQTQFAANWGFAADRGDLAFYYGQYLRLMAHWRATLPADRLLEVDYETSTSCPDEAARQIVSFCGLPWDESCLRPERNADAVKTASKWQARQPVYRTSVERWRKYEPWLGELRSLAPGA